MSTTDACAPVFAPVRAGLRAAFFAGVVATLLALAGLPVEGQARVRSAVDTTLVTVGDRITLTVRVEHPADASVVWPDSIDLTPFEVLGARLEPTATGEGGAVSSAVFSLTAFELGELEVPSFEVSVLSPDGRTEVVETDRFGIEVVSVGADEGGDIREIRGPLSIAVSAVRLLLLALLLMLLGAAAYGAYRRWRAGRVPVGPVERGPPPRAPHEIALEALAVLEGSDLLLRGEVKEFHVQVSDILRRYVEAAFEVPALEMTTWEVMEGLERIGAPGEARVELRRFLDECDLVKFAKVRPDADSARRTLGVGRSFVEGTAGRGPVRVEPTEVST